MPRSTPWNRGVPPYCAPTARRHTSKTGDCCRGKGHHGSWFVLLNKRGAPEQQAGNLREAGVAPRQQSQSAPRG
jgi:hypothetical protein